MRALLLSFLCVIFPVALWAESLRLAVYNTGLSRKGPGMLYADIVRATEPDILGVAEIVRLNAPDILLLMDFDYDAEGRAVSAFKELLSTGNGGVEYPYHFAPKQNAGLDSGHDLDGDGRDREPEDALGYGRFAGDGAMVLLSRYPIDQDAARDFSHLLWREVPWANLPQNSDNSPFPSDLAQRVMRLSSKSHWDVPVILPNGARLHIWANHSSPPVFDGPEDANGLRNHDEARFWLEYLQQTPDDTHFALLAGLNADPLDGEGAHDVIQSLLAHPRFLDPKPGSVGGVKAAASQGGRNTGHRGDPKQDTADWNDETVGNLRVDYILPSASLQVLSGGVFWPDVMDPLLKRADSRHRLVWVDVALPLATVD